MVEITSETYERFNKRFPDPTMSAQEIAAELDHMNPSDAEEYDAVLCNELFNGWCADYIQFTQKRIKRITGSEEYKVFKKRFLSYL